MLYGMFLIALIVLIISVYVKIKELSLIEVKWKTSLIIIGLLELIIILISWIFPYYDEILKKVNPYFIIGLILIPAIVKFVNTFYKKDLKYYKNKQVFGYIGLIITFLKIVPIYLTKFIYFAEDYKIEFYIFIIFYAILMEFMFVSENPEYFEK